MSGMQNAMSNKDMNASHSLSRGKLASKIMTYVLLVGLSALFTIPFIWLLSSSLKTDAEIFQIPPTWIPNPPRWINYSEVMDAVPFWTFFFNSVKIAVLVMIGYVFVSAMVAYAFARLRAPGKNALFMLLLATMMLPSQVTMIPLYVMFAQFGWVNTHLPLIVPAFAGSALYIFLIRQFFSGIPHSMDEAANIDGAGYFTIFFRIILPMSKPVLITVALFSIVGSWNDFMGPLIYLNSVEKFTMAIGLNMFKTQFIQNWNYTMAFNVMMIIPVLALFFFAQKFFIQGIVVTGDKG